MLQLLTAEIQTEMHEKETQLSLDAFMLNHPGSSGFKDSDIKLNIISITMIFKKPANSFNNRRLTQCCISHRLTKTGQQKIGRNCLVLVSLDFIVTFRCQAQNFV